MVDLETRVSIVNGNWILKSKINFDLFHLKAVLEICMVDTLFINVTMKLRSNF